MLRRTSALSLLALSLAAFAPALAHAGEDDMRCTEKPRAEWKSETDMKALLLKEGYKDIRSLAVKGTCYEVYAKDKDGKRTEVYVDPTTGAVVHTGDD
ncbi:PepSY domain-containing protein [Pseudoxanthobacter sp.]|uniref:PepSY domain-containing protein n=1 Tax=Pseudoxanthobacter sp. TaxID=1925742 RepID=UPI002FDF5936